MTQHGEGGERDDEQALGDTDQARAANLALRALVRAARSFLFYDAHNEAVTRFLEELKHTFEDYCHRYGDLDLVLSDQDIRLGAGGEVIYRETDRERSLAFRLYRDGVRRMVIRGRVGWDDLVSLLEVLSVRYTGLRQQEDDMVTLLRRASFNSIEINAVQGFVSDDDPTSTDQRRSDELILEEALARVQVPKDFDLPPPRLTVRKKASFVPIPDDLRARAAAEGDARRLPLNCLSLASLLLDQAADGNAGAIPVSDFLPLLTEIRDYMLTDGELRGLVELRRLIQEAPPQLAGRGELLVLVADYGDPGSISRLVRSVPPAQAELPAAFHELLATLPGDVPAVLMDLMHEEHSSHLRRVLRQALEPRVQERQTEIMQRVREDPGHGGADLLRALSTCAPEAARRLVVELAVTGTPEIQEECIHIIGRSSHGPTARKLLLQLFDDPTPKVRETAGQVLGEFKDSATFKAIRALAERKAISGLDPEVATILGTTLAAVAPTQAQALFGEWTQQRGRLRLSKAGEDQLPWIAIAGLAALDAPTVDEELKAFAERSSGDLARAATEARIHRARRLQGEEGS